MSYGNYNISIKARTSGLSFLLFSRSKMRERLGAYVSGFFGIAPRTEKLNIYQITSSFINSLLLIISFVFLTTNHIEFETLGRLGVTGFVIQKNFLVIQSLCLIIMSNLDNAKCREEVTNLKNEDKNNTSSFLSDSWLLTILQFIFSFILILFDLFFTLGISSTYLMIPLFWVFFYSLCSTKLIVRDFKHFCAQIAHRFEVNIDELEMKKDLIANISSYSKLTNIATEISYAYGSEIAVIFLFDIMYITYYLYKVIQYTKILLRAEALVKWALPTCGIMVNLIYVFLWFYDIWIIVNSAEKINSRAVRFSENLLQKVVKDIRLMDDEKITLHMAINKLPNMTAYGFCNIDYSFIYSMTAMTVTYLIILTQFNAF